METKKTNLDTAEKELTFKDIVLNHVNKICLFSSVEFRGGYWQTQSTGSSGGITGTVEVYIPDSREVYSNAVECLYDLLYPHFDDIMKKSGKVANEKIDKAFTDTTIVKEPSNEDEHITPAVHSQQNRLFDNQNDRVYFRTLKRDINRQLFRALCCFLNRKGYLKIDRSEV